MRPLSPCRTAFLAVTGARAGAGLLEALRRVSPAGGRSDLRRQPSLPPPQEGWGLDGLLDWYAGALLGQIPCLRMDAVGRREELLNHPGLKGLVYHTVKFCDFYAFEYENLRRRTALPLLKVETDFTPLSSGQLSTRLEAFLEGLELRPAPAAAARRGAYVAGIDSGSTTTNVVVLDRAGNVAASAIVRTGPKASQGAEKAFAALGGFTPEDMAAIVATGYGRNNIPFATGQVTEITCHARGLPPLPGGPGHRGHRRPGRKVICLDESGGVTNFVMNDKCAAGTGRFLELMARTLELSLEEMALVGLH
ncbi:MAG: BadF/BadG/BcrA/BcrD ATPase family protein [Flavonifractor plautii]